jgi:predicted transposase/invertase (TIGR01784 family)
MNTLKYISGDDEVRAIADLRQQTINDKNSETTIAIEEAREEAREEGIAIGEEKGIAIGEQRGKQETAKKLLQKGISIEDIADVTGLTIEEVKALDFL